MANQALIATDMTCGHYETSMQEEVSELPGITDIQAGHSRNFPSVTSNADIDTAAMIAAVDETDYKMAAS